MAPGTSSSSAAGASSSSSSKTQGSNHCRRAIASSSSAWRRIASDCRRDASKPAGSGRPSTSVTWGSQRLSGMRCGCRSTPHKKPSSMLTSSGSSGAGTRSRQACSSSSSASPRGCSTARRAGIGGRGRGVEGMDAIVARPNVPRRCIALSERLPQKPRPGLPRIGDIRSAASPLQSRPSLSHEVLINLREQVRNTRSKRIPTQGE